MNTTTDSITAGAELATVAEIPAGDGVTRLTIDRATFTAMAKNAHAMASHDDMRPILTGALLEFAGAATVRVVCTDSYRLLCQTVALSTRDDVAPAGPAVNVILEAAGLKDAAAAIARDKSGPPTMPAPVVITCEPGARTATVTSGAVTLAVHVIDGEFPRYQQLGYGATGCGSDTVDACARDIEPGESGGFNPAFLADIGKLVSLKTGKKPGNGETVIMAGRRLKPAAFELTGQGDHSVVGLLMPVRRD